MKDYKKHTHEWHPRTKYAGMGYYITGYICRCGKKEYVDLLKGIQNETIQG